MYVLGRFIAVIGLVVAVGEGWYLITHKRAGSVDYDWAWVGAGVGLAITAVGGLFIYLDMRAQRRRTH